VTGGWRELHNEEVCDLYSSPNVIEMIKSRRKRCAEHVARMRRQHLQFIARIAIRKETTMKTKS
jgi:hypothetical protein